jgi:hypothetical protein
MKLEEIRFKISIIGGDDTKVKENFKLLKDKIGKSQKRLWLKNLLMFIKMKRISRAAKRMAKLLN